MILEIRFRGEHFGVNGPVGRCLGGTGLERKTPAVTVRGEKPKGRSEITGRMIRGVGGGYGPGGKFPGRNYPRGEIVQGLEQIYSS